MLTAGIAVGLVICAVTIWAGNREFDKHFKRWNDGDCTECDAGIFIYKGLVDTHGVGLFHTYICDCCTHEALFTKRMDQ